MVASDSRGVEAGFPFPQYSIHRGELQFLLLDAVKERLGPEGIDLGHRFEKFTQDDSRVTAYFAVGGAPVSISGDLLIGADGFHSYVRRQLHRGEDPAHVEGMMLRRGACDREPFGTGARCSFLATTT